MLGKQCSCMNHRAKQAIEWALDYHISDIAKELRIHEIILDEAKQEFFEITGHAPGQYGIEKKIERLQKEHTFYIDLRKEIIQLKECPEPAFEV